MITFSILTFLGVVSMVIAQQSYFKEELNYNVDSTVYQSELINKFKKSSKTECLFICNQLSSCLTAIYNPNAVANENCFLYNITFTINQLLTVPMSFVLFKKSTNLCKIVTTFGDVACLKTDRHFYRAFNEMNQKFQFNRFSNTAFKTLLNFDKYIDINGKVTYYLVDRDNTGVFVYDENWNPIKFIRIVNAFFITIGIDCFYISTGWAIYKYDMNGGVDLSQTTGFSYRGSYFNKTDNTLLIAPADDKAIHIFDQNLILISKINLTTYYPRCVYGLENQIFVSATDGIKHVILIIENNIITNVFQMEPYCGTAGAFSVLADDYGYMVVNCGTVSNLLYTNGTLIKSLGFKEILYMNFDLSGRLIVNSHSGFFIYY